MTKIVRPERCCAPNGPEHGDNRLELLEKGEKDATDSNQPKGMGRTPKNAPAAANDRKMRALNKKTLE